jgi:FtsP/CotA-like multicopper oxidase with cupredoxin domain
MRRTLLKLGLLLCCSATPALAGVYVQCPAPLLTQGVTATPAGNCGDAGCYMDQHDPSNSTDPGCTNPDAPDFFDTCKVLIDPVTGQPSGATNDPHIVCRSITCGDGHATMADGNDIFIFGFRDVTNSPESKITSSSYVTDPVDGSLTGGATLTAPTFFAKEGQSLYITLTNTGFRERPDLTDAHTIHYHGFPNAGSVFDGEPMASFGIGLGASLTYFYQNEQPGTYMWHCHVEAAEHIQMGMTGSLYITPAQDDNQIPYQGKVYSKFAYNDCWTLGTAHAPDPMCGSTGYDVSYFMQETALDPVFHHNDQTYQKVNFTTMNENYPLLNGRGYPDTVNPGSLTNAHGYPAQQLPAAPFSIDGTGARSPLALHVGQKMLLHLTSLATAEFFTLTSSGIPFRVVGQGAMLLRGPDGTNTSYATNSITLSGGEGYDVLLDTSSVPPGTYFLYTTNLNHLSNDADDFGGMMTEVVVAP